VKKPFELQEFPYLVLRLDCEGMCGRNRLRGCSRDHHDSLEEWRKSLHLFRLFGSCRNMYKMSNQN
jgi:hypothetical protein